jgi:hypothetical protein
MVVLLLSYGFKKNLSQKKKVSNKKKLSRDLSPPVLARKLLGYASGPNWTWAPENKRSQSDWAAPDCLLLLFRSPMRCF